MDFGGMIIHHFFTLVRLIAGLITLIVESMVHVNIIFVFLLKKQKFALNAENFDT